MPFRSRVLRSLAGPLILTVLTIASAGCSKTADTVVVDPGPIFELPNGNPDKILEFIKDLRSRQPNVQSREEAQEYYLKLQRTMIAAGDKILAQRATDDQIREAATLKLIGTLSRAGNDDRKSPEFTTHAKAALDLVEKLRADPRPPVVEAANEFWVAARSLNFHALNDAGKSQLIDDLVEYVKRSKFSQESIADGAFVAVRYEEAGDSDGAARVFDRLSDMARESNDRKIQSYAANFTSKANRLRLPGKFLPLEGKLLNGEMLDWESYRGKVVLVDFWATWCGPCVAELPNVKENYEKFHSKGFDVVAVSLDRRRRDLESFVERESLPWVQMFDEEVQIEKRQPSPMAYRYGVNSIPTAFLLDKEGKVVSTSARGPELTRLLEKLLGT